MPPTRQETLLAPQHQPQVVADAESLLPLMAEQLDPYWADFYPAGGTDFGDYLTKRGDEVSESLLSITDARAANSTRPAIIKAYKAVRGHATKHVIAARPQVGALVQKYAA